MTRLGVSVGVVLAATVVAVVGLAQGWWRGGAHVAQASKPLTAATSLSTARLSFGDRLTARIEVLVDPAAVDVSSVRVRPRFAPYRVVALARTTTRGDAVLLSYRYDLECLSEACIPSRAPTEHRFPPARVSYRTASGSTAGEQVGWPGFEVASRLSDSDRASPGAHLRSTATLPPVSYRIAPGTAHALLVVLSVLFALAAASLAVLALRPPRAPAAVADADELSPLARALLRVRASTLNGQTSERRRALGNLGRELRAVERDALADDSARLAWSAHDPSPQAATAFAERVEATVEEER